MRIDINYLTLPKPEAVLLLKDEVRRLRGVITALADQDATLSVQGGTEDPMAYLAFAVDGSESCDVYITEAEAQAAADALGGHVMPLYLSFRLTDEEQEAVEFFSAMEWPTASLQCKARSATLRGLLERLA